MSINGQASNTSSLLCPACKVDLVMTERQSIEVDYCPRCRGVWLDRGELDKIIERVTTQPSENRQPPPGAPQQQSPEYPSTPAEAIMAVTDPAVMGTAAGSRGFRRFCLSS